MNLGPLIASVLQSIETQFYADRKREFCRDRNALLKAIMRYGHECNQRGWELEEKFILQEIMGVLISMREKKADIKYLPKYLEGAMRRHVGQRSEEIQAESKRFLNQVNRTIKTIKVADETVRVATAVESMALIYRDLKRPSKKKAAPSPITQPSLL